MHCRYVIDLLYIQLTTVRSFMTFDAIEEIHIYMYSPNGVGSSRVGYLSLCIGPCAPAPLRPCACYHRHPRAPATIHHGPHHPSPWADDTSSYMYGLVPARNHRTFPLDLPSRPVPLPKRHAKMAPQYFSFLQTSPTTAHHAGYGSAPSTRRSLRQDNLPGFFPPSSDGGVSVHF